MRTDSIAKDSKEMTTQTPRLTKCVLKLLSVGRVNVIVCFDCMLCYI